MPEGTMTTADVGLRAVVDLLTVEPLVRLDADGRPTPQLAEGWAWEDDGLTLRLRLPPDVTFHDGSPLNAEVVAGILRDVLAAPGSQVLYPSLADVTGVRAEGALDVVIELSRPSAFLPDDLSFPLRSPDNSVGSGPFRLIDDAPRQATLERFDTYHQGVPQIDRVEIQVFDSLRPAWASLLRGELDMVYDVPPEAIDFLQSEDVRVLRHARPYQYLIAFNSARAPFQATAVRRALGFAVDRGALVESVLGSNGQPSSGPISPEFWAYDESVGSYAFDPTLAEALLDQAGLLRGAAPESDNPDARLRFTCVIPEGFSVVERLALEVQRYLYDVGVDMQIEAVSANDFNVRIRDGEFEAMLIDAISGPSLSRSYGFWRSARTFQGLNVFGYENAEAEAIFSDLRAAAESDATVRTATRRLQASFLEDPPALFLAWNERARAVRSSFEVTLTDGRDPLSDLWRWRPAP